MGWIPDPRGGNTREHPFSIIAFGIGCETHDFKQPPGLYGKKPVLVLCPASKLQNLAQGLKGFCERH
jgi:hypothetical protein